MHYSSPQGIWPEGRPGEKEYMEHRSQTILGVGVAWGESFKEIELTQLS